MKTTKMSTILVVALGLMLWPVEVSVATEMGTAFTYQGWLMDHKKPANDIYDFQFALYDDPDPNVGMQVSISREVNDVNIVDGHFTLLLDFGSDVFDGNAVWLDIGVRPGDSNDVYTTLSPRQEVTPTPYALYAASGPGVPMPLDLSGSSSDPIIKGTNTGSGHGIYGEAAVSGADGVYGSHSGGTWGYIGGSVRGVFGKNTNNTNMGWLAGPDEAVRGDSFSGYGIYGSSTNRAIYGLAFNNYGYNGYSGYFENGNFYVGGGYVGIGTDTPSYELDVYGSIRATGTIYGNVDNADKVDGYHAGNSSGQVAVSNGTLCTDLNADKLDGLDASSFLSTASDYGRSGVSSMLYEGTTALADKYLGKTATAANSDKIDGYHAGNSSGQVAVSNGNKCTNLNADMLDGQTGSYYRNWDNLTNVPPGFADNIDDVGSGITLPYSGSASTSGNAFSITNSGTGRAIYGYASDGGSVTNYGGYFWARGSSAYAVYGKATNSGDTPNYGGYFEAWGTGAHGVHGKVTKPTGIGVYGENWNDSTHGYLGGMTRAVYGYTTSYTAVEGYGGSYDFDATGPGINYGSTSSIRWKSDIRLIDDPLGKVTRLRGVYFDWDKEHGGHHDVGMIAEEVGDVLPEIVGYEENGIDATGMDYSKLTPLLVEAVKALKIEINELQKQNAEKDGVIDTLKQQNDRLEGRLAALESSIATITVQLEGGGK